MEQFFMNFGLTRELDVKESAIQRDLFTQKGFLSFFLNGRITGEYNNEGDHMLIITEVKPLVKVGLATIALALPLIALNNR